MKGLSPCPVRCSPLPHSYPKNKPTWEQTQTRRETAWLVPRALLWVVLPHTHFWTRDQLLGGREGLSKQGLKGPEPPTLTLVTRTGTSLPTNLPAALDSA